MTGCNETFEPWQENDQYFYSIYGYLDATADTQWVRVMPVRRDLFLEPKPIDARVTLEEVQSGKSTVMTDSLFSYAHNRYAYNFWTTMKLQSGHTYRTTVKRSDGNFSYAEVTLPEDFPTPKVQIDYRSEIPINTVVFIDEVERLADVQTVFHPEFDLTGEEYLVGRSHLRDTVRKESGNLEIIINPEEDFQFLDNFYHMTPPVGITQYLTSSSPYGPPLIFIASAGPGYHFFPSIDGKIEALPEGVSNVENGTGYLAGIVSKTIPYKSCTEGDSIEIVPCELRSPPW